MTHDTTSHSNMIRRNADFVLKNGMVYTVDKDRSRAESIAVSGKKIERTNAILGSFMRIASNWGLRRHIGPLTFWPGPQGGRAANRAPTEGWSRATARLCWPTLSKTKRSFGLVVQIVSSAGDGCNSGVAVWAIIGPGTAKKPGF